MEGHPTPHSQRSCWRRALNPWQALGKGSGVSPSVCHPRSLLPGVAAQPRTGTPAYLLGLVLPGLVPLPLAPTHLPQPVQHAGHHGPAAGPAPRDLHLAQRATWYVGIGKYICLHAPIPPPPFLNLHLSCLGKCVGGQWGLPLSPNSRFSGIPNFKVPSSHVRPSTVRGEGSGQILLGNVYVGHHEADMYALHVHVLTD